jgi:DNA-binding response OmpR family regulator
VTKKILLVSTDRCIASDVFTMLQGEKYSVEVHRHTWDTLVTFYNMPSRFDLVIADEAMKDLPGVLLAEKLFAIRPRLPFILILAADDRDAEEKARSKGVKWCVSKPLSAPELQKTVGAALQRRKV